ncbi:MAG: ABC transporter ATP-binding protein, partial [Clostridioides sp.]|nr:ABC transporter ATP-binding protein [Clostridioides sp.]
MEVLKVVNLQKYYGVRNNLTKVLSGVNFSIERGEFVGIMGASGSGKTTLLNCISTIDFPTAGSVFINEKDITQMDQEELSKFRREELGFVFQDFNLLDTLTIYENIALSLALLKEKIDVIDEKVKDIATILGIDDILDKYPIQISGGQKQRVTCARAIVNDPSIIMADEPTGALDSKSAINLLRSFEYLVEKRKSTIFMVTHDAFAASFCQKIFFLRDGKI